MTIWHILTIAVCLSLWTVLTAAVVLALRQHGTAPKRIGYRVTVHTKQPDDQTIFGVLTGDYKDRIVLEDAEYVTSTGAKPLPGKQHINVADIAWMDVHQQVAPVEEGMKVG